MMNKIKDYIIIALIVIGTILMIQLNKFKHDDTTIVLDSYELKVNQLQLEIHKYRDLAKFQAFKIDSLKDVNIKLHADKDSIAKTKQKVKHIYHEVYTNITVASNTELDSIIRSNW